MKKLVLSAFIIIIVLVLFFLPLFRKHPKVNPEIFPVFRQIEKRCLNYALRENVNLYEYERCQKVNNLHQQAIKSEFYEAEEYYKNLSRLGFNLPPLYKEQ